MTTDIAINKANEKSELIDCRFYVDYGNFKLDIDQRLPAQGVTVLLGDSGCGKSTLLRCIAGLERAQRSYFRFDGEVWDDSVAGLHRPTHQRTIGYVFQEASLFPHLSVRDNLEFGRKRAHYIRSQEGLEQAVELLGIGHLLDRMPDRLSGGERQRVAIARALAVCPQLLLMDEPLAALDLRRKQEILPFIDRLHHELEIPVLYVTHSPQEVTRLADHVIMLDAGKVIAAGPLESTLTRLDTPLADSRQASTVFRGRVVSTESEYQLMQVCVDGAVLSLPYRQQPEMGAEVRLRVYARDVSLALQIPAQSSITNIVEVRIAKMIAGEAGQMVVQLQLGAHFLLAHITRKSVIQMGLQPGMSVFAQIKAVALV